MIVQICDCSKGHEVLPLQYFTDSLCWIKGTDKTWKPFVQNQVNEIRKLTSTELWKQEKTTRPTCLHVA